MKQLLYEIEVYLNAHEKKPDELIMAHLIAKANSNVYSVLTRVDLCKVPIKLRREIERLKQELEVEKAWGNQIGVLTIMFEMLRIAQRLLTLTKTSSVTKQER